MEMVKWDVSAKVYRTFDLKFNGGVVGSVSVVVGHMGSLGALDGWRTRVLDAARYPLLRQAEERP